MPILFDDSLPHLVEAISNNFDDDALRDGVVVRDATGRLSFVSPRQDASEDFRARISQVFIDALGPYARRDNILSFADDPGAPGILRDPSRFVVKVGEQFCQLIDRRIVGSAWLDEPAAKIEGPPRLVYASIKGGVGRSTALAVTAADLAHRNKNVLVVDLDLEAPGLGSLLLDEHRSPRFGTVDYLVENGIGGISESLLDDCIGTSALTTGGGGRVDVVPALGSRSNINPENVLPKLSRAMIEDISEAGEIVSVASQISTMIECLTAKASYDAVLIDARAGFGELVAPAILGLGATALLFGTAQRQTIDGYRALFAALKMLAQRDRMAKKTADWRLELKAVYAKSSLDEHLAASHRDDLYELFAEQLYDAEDGTEELDEDAINFDIDDENAPHWPLIIPFTAHFVDFDPVRRPNQLTQPFYEQTFKSFLDGIDGILESVASDSRAAPGGARDH